MCRHGGISILPPWCRCAVWLIRCLVCVFVMLQIGSYKTSRLFSVEIWEWISVKGSSPPSKYAGILGHFCIVINFQLHHICEKFLLYMKHNIVKIDVHFSEVPKTHAMILRLSELYASIISCMFIVAPLC
jgi:hypothetical protein